MMKAEVTEEGAATADPLELCLMFLAAELGRPMTLAGLRDGEAGFRDSLSLADGVRAAERCGFTAVIGTKDIGTFDTSLLPALILTKTDRPMVLVARLDGSRFAVFDPEFGGAVTEMQETQLAALHSGLVLLMRPRQSMASDMLGEQGGHWFWATLAKSKWLYIQVILAAIVANLLSLTTSIFTMTVYDRIIPSEGIESLIALTIGVGIALLFDFIIKLLRSSFIDRAGHHADIVMGRRIFDQLLDLQLRVNRGSTGALASTLREFETLREFFTSASLVTIVDLPFVILFIYVIYLIGGPLAWVPGIAVPLVLLLGIVLQPILAKLAEEAYKDGQAKQSVLVEAIAGIETIKAVGAGRVMRHRWDNAVTKQSERALKTRALTQLALNAAGLVQQMAQVLIVFYGVFLIQAGVTSQGALIASVILMGRALAPLSQLAQTMVRMNQARTSFKSLNKLMNDDRERGEDKQWLSRPKLLGGIEFRDVAFSYPNQQAESLRDISFKISPGERVAILGRIGSGKSTVARLMLGLYQPSRGAVLVDGTDLRQVDPADLRRNIGAALQDVWLFSGTVRENIAVGADRPREADILRAATIAGVDEFMREHPQGYDCVLAERGEGLSGGQRQTISLARALIGDPPILLLDEPTSAMDVQSEARLISRLKLGIQGQTLVVITHRTSLLELVDRVIVIEEGKVGFDGPKSLIARRAVAATARGETDGEGA